MKITAHQHGTGSIFDINRNKKLESEFSPNTITGRVREKAILSGSAGQACPENGAIGQNKLPQKIKVVLPRFITVLHIRTPLLVIHSIYEIIEHRVDGWISYLTYTGPPLSALADPWYSAAGWRDWNMSQSGSIISPRKTLLYATEAMWMVCDTGSRG